MNRQYRECEACGALLGDRQKHERWHRETSKQLATALSAVQSREERVRELSRDLARM